MLSLWEFFKKELYLVPTHPWDHSCGFLFNWSGVLAVVEIFKSSPGDFNIQLGLRTIVLDLVTTGHGAALIFLPRILLEPVFLINTSLINKTCPQGDTCQLLLCSMPAV